MGVVSFSPDGATLASTVRLWNVATGTEKTTLRGHTATVYSVSFSPNGATLASASWDCTVRLWDVATGTEKTILRGHTAQVDSVSFSPDGATLASGGADNTVVLWDVATGTEHTDSARRALATGTGKPHSEGIDLQVSARMGQPSQVGGIIRWFYGM